MADPVDDELVISLARPGGTASSGTTFLGPQLVMKQLQLLSEVVPQHVRVAILWHPRAYSDRTMGGMVKEAERAAQLLGMQLHFVPANSPEEIIGTFFDLDKDRVDVLCVFPSPMLFAEYRRIVGFVAERNSSDDLRCERGRGSRRAHVLRRQPGRFGPPVSRIRR